MTGLLSNYSQQPRISRAALAHFPGTDGWPVIGESLRFLADPLAYSRHVVATYGPVSRAHFMFERKLNLISAEANEFVLLDRAGNFSAYRGWEPVLGQLFPRGLMLRDGNDHRYHRRLMQPAFRKEALVAYDARMQPRIARAVQRWIEQRELLFYPEIKRLTLEIAADVFLGLELQSEIDEVAQAFTAVVDASTAINRFPLIGRSYARGLAARTRLVTFIEQRMPARRSGKGSDLLSQLCRAEDESGQRYSDSEIVDHLIFLMMAAHDTTTSALTTIVFALTEHEDWQARLRGRYADPAATDEALEEVDWVLRESLRLYPPLSIILRRAVRECVFQDWVIPAGTAVTVYPVATQRLPQWWSDPDRFDPERFSAARAEHRRHPFAWAPFGGGAHMCLGLHFAEMQVRSVLRSLLLDARVQTPGGYRMPYQLAPIAKPRDGLPLSIQGLS